MSPQLPGSVRAPLIYKAPQCSAAPPENNWNWQQPPEPFPPCPSRGCFLGPSVSEKTTTLISMLLGPYKLIYDALYVFSPSVEIDNAWGPVREFAKGLKQHGLFSE